ncbi:MAG: HNH endonuclease [Thermodesulfobacteriota bacterium]
MAKNFLFEFNEKHLKLERQKARLLRQSRWWKQKIAEGRCYYCQQKFPPAELTMDHIVPISRGGQTTKGNVVPVCKDCNNKKKYLLLMEWEEYVKGDR